MPPKRKATSAVQGAAKVGRVSEISTPGPSTPRSLDGSVLSEDAEGADPNFSELLDDDKFNDGVDDSQKRREDQLMRDAEKFTNDYDIFKDKPPSRPSNFRGDAVSSYFRDRDLSYLHLKPDHKNRPMFINPDTGTIILERFNPLADQAADFLVTIAEPESRPTFLHEYKITMHSLYAAVSVGLNPRDIMNTLDRFLKTPLPGKIRDIINETTKSYGKVKLVLKNNKYFVESSDTEILHKLLKDPVIGPLRIQGSSSELSKNAAPTARGMVIPGTKNAAGVQQAGLQTQTQGDQPAQANEATEADIYAALNEDDEDDSEAVHSFEISDDGVEIVQSRCLDLKYPMLSEYDFRNDDVNANLDIDLRPNTQIRPYQEKSLSKMFGNGRAKSGIIVLPCGAGKTLVGITAACTIKKGVIVLCTSAMSVVQWRNEFLKWSNIKPEDITTFTADNKEKFSGNTGIIVTTYSMIAAANSKRVAHDSKKMADFLKGREWGLMLLDEVHVTPANVFRRVMTTIKSHAKLGLTATLVREDDKISDLNFLIGPKLYEANWMELSQQGHIAKVQCAEVWCPMPTEFYDEYLNASGAMKRVLCAMNPRKFQACQYLMKFHEERGDKVIVFSDELYPLKQYATRLGRFFIEGKVVQQERMQILERFQRDPQVNTIFLSKIGDTSLDLPEATVLIQISSHFGSRRQEAQRLGRILRAKRRNDEGFNAFFYTLVSKDTQEMYYSSRRQSFLVDQGYSFKVITQLAGLSEMPDLAFDTAEQRRELLQRVLVDNEKGAEQELNTDDMHYLPRGKGGRGKKTGVRRTAGMLGELSGGHDMAYVEQSRGAGKASKKGKGVKSDFFRKLDQQQKKKAKAIKDAQEAGE